MQLGLTMAGCVGFCFYVGLKLDQWFSTGGLLVALFTVLGVVGGGIVVYRQIMEVVEQGGGTEEERDGTDETKGSGN